MFYSIFCVFFRKESTKFVFCKMAWRCQISLYALFEKVKVWNSLEKVIKFLKWVVWSLQIVRNGSEIIWICIWKGLKVKKEKTEQKVRKKRPCGLHSRQASPAAGPSLQPSPAWSHGDVTGARSGRGGAVDAGGAPPRGGTRGRARSTRLGAGWPGEAAPQL